MSAINEFVKREIEVWGFEYVEDLFDNGYEPTLLADANGSVKWAWVQTSVVSRVKRVKVTC